METLTFLVNPEDAGRLDAFLAAQAEDLTRSGAARLIEEGRVLVDGKRPAKSLRLGGGETVTVELPDPEPLDVQPEDIPLDIVYEDGDVIVVNKPKGLVVHPAPGHPDGTLVNALLHHCGASLSGIGGVLRPGIVHRIDRDTSGLIIAAKNDLAHQKLAAQLADHTLARTYECIVVGNLREDSGTVDAPIGRCPADRKKQAVVSDGRRAVTHWEVIARYPGFTHVRCRLETGRTHQIRVHMAYIGHPILGDTVYGAKKPVPGLQGQCLHAVGLQFLHPRTGEAVTLSCPLPEEFQTQPAGLDGEDWQPVGAAFWARAHPSLTFCWEKGGRWFSPSNNPDLPHKMQPNELPNAVGFPSFRFHSCCIPADQSAKRRQPLFAQGRGLPAIS